MASLKGLKPDHVYGVTRSAWGNYSAGTYRGVTVAVVRGTQVDRGRVTVHPVDLPEDHEGVFVTINDPSPRTGRQLSPEPICSVEEWPEYAAREVARVREEDRLARERRNKLAALDGRAEHALEALGWTGATPARVADIIAGSALVEEELGGPDVRQLHNGKVQVVSSGALAFLEALEGLAR